MTHQEIIVDAKRYEDHDDCLTAAAEEYAAQHDLAGWDLSPRWEDDATRNRIILTVPRLIEDAATDVPTLAEALEWARTADAGSYLVHYEDTGLTDDEDPGSRCGYDDSELDAIRKALRERDLTLNADDVGLCAAPDEE